MTNGWMERVMAAIGLRGVRKSFDRTEVLHGVDLEFEAGEFVVILGPSGCGKSTLLRLIAGLEAATAGTIEIAGQVVNDLPPKDRGGAMVFQNYALYPHMTVAENIGYPLKVAGGAKDDRAARVRKVATMLGLDALLDRRPHQLSGGQRQRVAMGRALIREPKVFLFDEPLSNLDAKLRAQMRVEIRDFHRRVRITSVYVTHDQVEAMTLADRLVVMHGGRVEQVGTPSEIYSRPRTEFVAGFIGSPPMNFVPCTAAGDGRNAVLPDGQRLALPVRQIAGHDATALKLGLRPEHLVLVAHRAAADTIALELDLVEDLGATRLVHGRLAGHRVVVSTPLSARDIPTADGRVMARPSECILFEDGRARLSR
jgi:sn-glycerol 3-phosphate transport system ATP-binding protein